MKWVKVFPSLEAANHALPINTPRRLIIKDKVLCIVRTSNKIWAMDNSCPHQNASLSQGTVNMYDEIICPLHEYRFNLSTGTECNHRTHDLANYQVEINPEGVFLKL